MVRGADTPPSITLAARRMALGQRIAPPPEIIYHLVAEKFGMWPDDVADRPVDEVLRAWQIMAALQPRERK